MEPNPYEVPIEVADVRTPESPSQGESSVRYMFIFGLVSILGPIAMAIVWWTLQKVSSLS
jgi:hypothetical protein